MTPEQRAYMEAVSRMSRALDQAVEDGLYHGEGSGTFYRAMDIGAVGGDHSAFVKYWVDEHGDMHVEDIRTEEVYERKLHFPRTLGRTVFEECHVQMANRPYVCPVRETRHWTMCHDGLRRNKQTKRWHTCEICQGFGHIE